MVLDIDTTLLTTRLAGALSFCNTYRRNTYPLIMSTNYLLPNSYHAVEGRRNYFPGSKTVGCATSEAQTSFARACFVAFEATNDVAWRTLGINVLQSFVDYFFVDPIPTTTKTWDSHWLCVAFGSTPTKGSQPNTTPPTDAFNFGNFDTNVTFTNGTGTLGTGSNLADVYKVYAGTLKYQNVYAPLLEGGTEYAIDYWVSNYALEGQNFRVYPNGNRTATSEQIGVIKLTTTFTGTAKVTWSDYGGGTVSAPTAVRSGQGLIEPYPMWNGCLKGNRTILNTAFDTYWWGWEAFDLAYKYTNNTVWQQAANSFRYTAQQAMNIENNSYYYKKENSSYAFRYPGSQAFTTNNLSNPKPTLTSSRETVTDKLNYVKLVNGGAIANSFPTTELQNFVVQTDVDSLLQVYVEAAITTSTVIEVKLSTSMDAFDFSQEYIAYWFLVGDSSPRNITFNVRDFIKYGDTVCWHPTIAENPIFTFSGLGGTITSQFRQENNQGTKPLTLQIDFNKGAGFAGCGINNASFTSSPPMMRFACSGSIKMRLQDASDNYWYLQLPDTGGQFQNITPSWSSFTGTGTPANGKIKECVFEVDSGTATLRINYLGNSSGYVPEVILVPSRAYKAAIVSKIRASHTFWVGDFRPIGNRLDKIPYTPGAVPFTRNTIRVTTGSTVETVADSWGSGMIYMGYLSPLHQWLWGNSIAANNQISMLLDAFTAYTNQSSERIRGLPQQVFLAALWDSAAFLTYGDKLDSVTRRVSGFPFPFLFDKNITFESSAYKLNTFGWKGADPNTAWFPYVARVMESVAKYAYQSGDNRAKSLATQYLTFLSNDYEFRGSLRPLTDVPPIVRPQSNYEEPHAAALIGRCALWANLAGVDPRVTNSVLETCYNYVNSQYVGSGVMAGSWSAGQPTFTHNSITYREYFSFWHAEIIEFQALLIEYKDVINYPTLAIAGLLPSIEPTRIVTVKEPSFKGNEFRFSDGNRQVLIHRRSQLGKSLTLQYDKVNDIELEQFVEFYRIHGTSELFEIPTDIAILQRHRMYGLDLNYWRLTNEIDFETIVATKTDGAFSFSISMEVCEKL